MNDEPATPDEPFDLAALMDGSDLIGRLRAWQQWAKIPARPSPESGESLAHDLGRAASAIELAYREAAASRSKRSVLRPTSSLVRLRETWAAALSLNDDNVINALSDFLDEETTPRPLRAEIYDHDIKLVGVMVEPGPLPHRWFWRVRHTSNGKIMGDGGEPYSSAADRDHGLALLHPDLIPVQVDR